MKACIACKHFSIEGAVWYSAQTGGNGASFNCAKNVFYESVDEGSEDALLTNGTNCDLYEISDLAKSKGWPA